MRVFVLAGEASGDRLGGALMAGLRELVPDVTFDGVGGAQMQAQGLVSRFAMEELSVMGLAEVLPRYFDLKRRIKETAQAVLDTKPDVLITIDSPDFSLRVAKLVKAQSDIRTVHYVAPSVWAWRPGRAAKMARVIDQVLALLPFEPPLMQAAGMACDFVGHPVVSEPRASTAEAAAFRDYHNIGDSQSLLLMLPGSRMGEVSRLLPVFRETLDLIRPQENDMRLAMALPPSRMVADQIHCDTEEWDHPVLLIDPDTDGPERKRAGFAAADLALAASGTVSLELAANGVPMVIAYKFNWLTWQIVSRMYLQNSATLVNLVSDTRAVPECLGPDCTPGRIARALEAVRAAPQAQTEAMAVTMQRLGQGGEDPGLRAARAVLERL